MPVLQNSRHERFAQLLAQGLAAVDAHQQAGYSRNDSNAAQLAKRPEIKARVTELNGNAATRAEITLESLLDEAADIQRAAFEDGQYAAANGALKLKAELSGHYVQRKENVTPRRSVEQIDAELRQFLEHGGKGVAAGVAGGTQAELGHDQVIPTVPGHGTA